MVCVKAQLGTNHRNIGWGVPENRPVWWPEHIPWSLTKNGAQRGCPKNGNFLGILELISQFDSFLSDHMEMQAKVCLHICQKPYVMNLISRGKTLCL